MLFFSKKYAILETPLFEGFKDYHTHILPSVDDGIQDMERSLEALAYFEKLNISEVVLTPHVMVGVNNSDEKVEQSYAALTSTYKGPIKLSLASEYMLDSNFIGHLQRGARLIDTSHILIETSYVNAPSNMRELIYEVSSSGLTPLIAHPERYNYMSIRDLHALRDSGPMFQLNLLSFSDMYGTQVTKKAKYLLENRLYNVAGSDLHRTNSFKNRISGIKLSSKHIDLLLELKQSHL